jgi:hypothetical protein
MSGYGHPLVVGWRGSLSSYARDLLPRAVADLDQPSPQQTRALVEVLARHIGDLRDDEEALRALCALAIVECTDGSFRQPGECYLNEARSAACSAMRRSSP